jgi:sugar lactone lactonase YvrE
VSMQIVGTISNGPIVVSAGRTVSVSVYYVVRGGSGALWIGWGFATDIATGVTSPQLAAAGSEHPADIIGAGATSSGEITASAFDLAGNLWVVDFIAGHVEEFTVEQLASGASTPAVTLIFSYPDNPWGLAFDASNNLWVSFYSANAVAAFSVSQVDGFSGTVANPTPQVTLTVPGALGLAFGPNGALWVAGYGDSTIYEFPPSAFASGGRPVDRLSSTTLNDITGVTFDASGNLWAATESGLLVNYSATQLAAATPPTAPHATIAASSRAYRFDQAAFDNSGNLWATTETADVVEYSPAQLAAGGSPVPARTLTIPNEGITAGTYSVAFDPRATGLPIAGQHVARMTDITSIFTNQSPPWMTESIQGLLSQRLAPTSMATGKPSHAQKPRRSAPLQSAMRDCLTKCASTEATTTSRTNSTSVFHAGMVALETAAPFAASNWIQR